VYSDLPSQAKEYDLLNTLENTINFSFSTSLSMNAKRKEEIRVKIHTAISELERKISNMEENTSPVAPENAIGRVSRMDAIQNKSVMESALRTARARLSKLRVALTKIDLPGFGECSLCQQPIPEGRLLFMPESTRCVRCADR
jgi:DnaK suppressor protein